MLHKTLQMLFNRNLQKLDGRTVETNIMVGLVEV